MLAKKTLNRIDSEQFRQAPRRSGRYGSPYVAVSLANPLSPPPKESEHAIASVLGSRGRRKNSEGSMYSDCASAHHLKQLGLAWLGLASLASSLCMPSGKLGRSFFVYAECWTPKYA